MESYFVNMCSVSVRISDQSTFALRITWLITWYWDLRESLWLDAMTCPRPNSGVTLLGSSYLVPYSSFPENYFHLILSINVTHWVRTWMHAFLHLPGAYMCKYKFWEYVFSLLFVCIVGCIKIFHIPGKYPDFVPLHVPPCLSTELYVEASTAFYVDFLQHIKFSQTTRTKNLTFVMIRRGSRWTL